MNISAELELIKLAHCAGSAHNIKITKNTYIISAEYESRSLKRAELYIGLKRTLSKRSLRGCNVLNLQCLERGIRMHLARKSRFEILYSYIFPKRIKYFTQINESIPWKCEWGHQCRDVWVAYPCNPDPCNIPLRPDPDLDPRPWAHPALSNT